MLIDGYVRVSRVGKRRGERFISPKLQREQIELWIASHGAVLGKIFVELDQSGGRRDRPLLMQALERVERGKTNGLIVAKLDRFGRSVIHGLEAIARIEAAGGTFVSVQDGLDLSTPTGKLVLRIMLAMAEWELDRYRENWDSARSHAVSRGVHISGRVPIGYLRGEDGCLFPDPVAGPVISEAYRRRAAGATSEEIAEFLNEAGVKTSSPRPYDAGEICRLIARRVYTGEAHHGRYANPRGHKPLVDLGTWRLAQFPRRKHWRIEGLLLGLISCAACGARMSATRPQSRASESGVYHCMATSRGCPAPAGARADQIEPLVEHFALAAARRRRPRPGSRALREQEEAVAGAQERLEQYRDNHRLQKTLGMASFERGVVKRKQALEQGLLDLARAKRAATTPAFDVEELEARWPGLALIQRREALAEFLDCVVVERGEAPIEQRTWVCARGKGPLLRSLQDELSPFDPLAVKARRLPVMGCWPRRRIETELFDFLGASERWPQYPEFAAAGRCRLHAQMERWGGPLYWARKLGLEIAVRDVRWNEARVRAALEALLVGRRQWPTRREFEQAGLKELAGIASRQGGVGYWAEQFDLEDPARPAKWSRQRVREGLEAFVGEQGDFPGKGGFEAAGLVALYEAARRYGGIPHWRREFAVQD